MKKSSGLSRSPSSSLLGALTFLATVGLIDAAPHRALPHEQLERYEDPPMLIWRNELSPRAVTTHAGFTSYQVNVDANGLNITGDAANEPSLCVDPTDHNRMAIGWRQFNSSASNFRQAGWGYTTNGGSAWTFPGVLQNNVFRSDPVLYSDSSGNFFYLSLLQNFFDDLWRALRPTFSWTRLGSATGGDKQWATIDNTNSSGHGFQYQCWSTAGNNYNGRQFSRSTNGGSVWSTPVNIPNSPIWGTLDVDSTGNLFIGGVNGDSGQVYCIRSSNAKNAAATPTFDRSTPVNLGGDIASGEPINFEGLVGQIYLVVDRSGTSTNNNIYMLASVVPTGAATGSEVMMIRSTNGGQSFSAPQRVNDDPANAGKWHWLASLSVAPNGRLDAVWLDTRNAANNFDSQLFYSYSMDAGVTWSANAAVSEPFNPHIGYPNQNKMGDYIASVSDNTGADVAYCATFNGEEDIYYVRVGPPSHLLNISSRASVLTGERVLIAGFIIDGVDPKRVLIRGIGPSLNLDNALPDPTLELHQDSTAIATNDNWKTSADGTSQQVEIESTGLAPSNDSESAILATLTPGQYTAVVSGRDDGTGLGLVEVYDVGQGANSNVANISTRAFVGTGDEILIGGFISDGPAAKVIVRGIGPSLAGADVSGALQDPAIELHDANGTTTATNDNWKTNDQTGQSQEAEVRATGLPPSNDAEAALVATLPPGLHTAIVRGKNDTTGIALVEVYKLQ